VLPDTAGSLTADQIFTLRKVGPTSDEAEAFQRYTGDKTLLSDVDQFLIRLLAIPNLKRRLDLLWDLQELPVRCARRPLTAATCTVCDDACVCPRGGVCDAACVCRVVLCVMPRACAAW
jgi:hypothetical protein